MEDDKPYRYFVCKCDPEKEFHEFAELKKHMAEAHDFTIEKAKGKKELMMHMNREPRHYSSYQWTFDNGIILYEYNG